MCIQNALIGNNNFSVYYICEEYTKHLRGNELIPNAFDLKANAVFFRSLAGAQ